MEEELGEGERRLQAGWTQRMVFVFCGIGLNVCFAIYLSYIRIYGTIDPSILGYMMISIYTAALSVVIFQGVAERYGPQLFSPKAKFGFFISLSFFMMIVTLSMMPFVSSKNSIILFGVLIGLFEGSGLTLSQELASAYSGDATKYVNTGHTIAQLFPVALSFAVGMYKEESAGRKSEIYFAFIPAGVCLFALLFYLIVLVTGGFDDAFEGMAQPEKEMERDAEEAPLLADGETGGTAHTPKEGAEMRWFDGALGTCVGVMILTHGMSAGFSPITQVVGTMAYTHLLMLLRFVAEFSGRMFSHLWGVQYFEWGTTALLVMTSVRVFLMLGLVVEAFMMDFEMERTRWIYASQVFFFYSVGSYVHSETMATAVDSRPKSKQTVAYVMMLLCFGAQLVALAAVVPILKGYDQASF
jgi:hypothetical protein